LLQSYIDYAGEAEAICDRTLRNDFTYLKMCGAQIERRKKSYYYQKPFEELNVLKSIIQIEDIEELYQTLEILQHFKHLPPTQAMRDLLERLKEEWGYEYKDPRKIIDFEEVELINEQQLNDLYKVIREEKTISINYLPFTATTPQDLVIYPYLLKEFRHRWYIVGLNKSLQKIQNIAIDRIKYWHKIENEKFISSPIPDILARFRDIIGVTLNENAPKEQIVVQLATHRARYVETKKWHHSQRKISEKDGKTVFEFELIINNELRSRILEYSGDIEVLKPLHLRSEIAEMLQKSLALYESN
jgi:predicted DNA-binding transcriptional regulator YafY